MNRLPVPPVILAFAALGMSSVACGPADAAGDRHTVRDSAGIGIVETSAPVWHQSTGWRISDSPALRLGVREGDERYLFSRVVGAVRLEDGTIAVADGSNQIRFYDEDGTFLRAVGGTGPGPGEFEYVRDLRRCGHDRIYAFDLHWQAKIYDPAGELHRELRLSEPGTDRTPYALACSPDGRFVISGWGVSGPPEIGLFTATSPVWLLDPDADPVAELGTFLSSERLGSPRGSRPHPFGRGTVLSANRERVYVGTGESFEILEFTAEGELTRILRGPAVDLEIRQEHLEGYRDERLSSVEDPDRRRQIRAEVRDMPLPAAFPAYDRLLLDAEENLWVRRFLRPGEEQRAWAVFDPRGVMLGEVSMPPRLEITEIGHDYVLGIHRDELDVERIQLHALEKP